MRHGNASGSSAAILLAGLLCPGIARAAGGGIEVVPDPFWLAVLVVLFAVLIWPVNRLIFQPLFRVLDERSSLIDGARERAAETESEAESVLARYEAEVARAREEAGSERRGSLERARAEEQELARQARGEAEAQLDRARREIAASLEEARQGLRPGAEELAREAAQRILGRELA